MNEKLNWFDRMMSAVTFAEAGEHDTAIEILNDGKAECPHCGGSIMVEGLHLTKA